MGFLKYNKNSVPNFSTFISQKICHDVSLHVIVTECWFVSSNLKSTVLSVFSLMCQVSKFVNVNQSNICTFLDVQSQKK